LVQVIGGQLELAFEALDIEAFLRFETTERMDVASLQVWEMTNKSLEYLIDYPDKKWKKEYGWIRSGRSVYEGEANTSFVVNGKPMMGYVPSGGYSGDTIEFDCYTDYLKEVMRYTTIKNVVTHAESLAKDNHMTLEDFMRTYQG
jgi:hypothetical protein